MWEGLQPAATTYSYLPSLGLIPAYKISFPNRTDTRYRVPDPLFSLLPDHISRPLLKMCGDFYRVKGTTHSVRLSILKMDFPRCISYQDNPYYQQSLDLTELSFEPVWSSSRFSSSEEIMLEINLSSSSGAFKRFGYKTKKDCFICPLFLSYLRTYFDNPRAPLWRIVDKVEWSSSTDIDNSKVRTFIMSPPCFLYYQKYFYSHQNASIVNHPWSAYGFNPYYGGVQSLSMYLGVDEDRFFIEYDVKGWDRKIPVLPEVYDLRHSFLPETDVDQFMIDSICRPCCIDPTGLIFQRETGNNSGSNNTTPDNICAHIICLNLILLDLFKGDCNKIKGVRAKLFGDDAIISIPKSSIRDVNAIEETFKRVFLSLGLDLDPFIVQDTLLGLGFLGFKFHKILDNWLPLYDLSRLSTAFCYVIEKMDEEMCLSKAYSLTVMSYPHGQTVFNKFRSALLLYFSHYLNTHKVNPFHDLSFDDLAYFYGGMEVGGIKKKKCMKELLAQNPSSISSLLTGKYSLPRNHFF